MLDIVFSETCLENKIIPKFLNFRVCNLHFKTSRTYHSCQMKLLREEMSVKKSNVKQFEKDFIVLKRKLRDTLGIIDYTHICSLFSIKNDRKLKHQQDIHSKKHFDLSLENSKTSHDPDKVIFDYSFDVLTKSEKSLHKGNSIAIIDKRDYLEKMRNILSDSRKFNQVSAAKDKQLNFIVNVEKHITDLLKDLKISEVISETICKS